MGRQRSLLALTFGLFVAAQMEPSLAQKKNTGKAGVFLRKLVLLHKAEGVANGQKLLGLFVGELLETAYRLRDN